MDQNVGKGLMNQKLDTNTNSMPTKHLGQQLNHGHLHLLGQHLHFHQIQNQIGSNINKLTGSKITFTGNAAGSEPEVKPEVH